jgi:hypothetical protein
MNDGLSERVVRPTELAAFMTICREAAARHGDNWPAIEQHIKRRFATLPSEQRQRLAREIDRVLRYRAPDCGMQVQ